MSSRTARRIETIVAQRRQQAAIWSLASSSESLPLSPSPSPSPSPSFVSPAAIPRSKRAVAASTHPHRHVSLLSVQTSDSPSLSYNRLSGLALVSTSPSSSHLDSPTTDVTYSPALTSPDSPLSVLSSLRSLPPTPSHRILDLPSPPTHRPRIMISESRSIRSVTSSTPSLPTLHEEDDEYVSFLDLS